MATLDAARVLGAGDDLGSIRAGKLADLVIVDGDPLANISEAANVTVTIINGRPYPIDELRRPGGRAAGVGNLYN
jgi:imidazolonepropionase-like amidohydrolase